MRKVLLDRTGLTVAADFSKLPMATEPRCSSCGACIDRCPYELPIPNILRTNYELFVKHASEARS